MPTATVSDRSIPHNLEAERALLGSILLDNSALKIALPLLTSEEWYSTAHRVTWQMMLRMTENHRPIDLVTLSEELAQEGLLEKAGGPVYLSALTDAVPIGTTAGVDEYVRIVKAKAEARALINLSQNVTARVIAGEENAEEILADLRSSIRLVEPPKAAPIKRTAYPFIPEEAWHGVAKFYRMAMQKTSEASDNFHLAGFLTAVGAMLGKTVALGADSASYIYPNLYMLLVGDSGTCKDQASKRSLGLLQSADPDSFVVNHVASAETLVDEMCEAKKKLEEKETKGPLRTLLYLSELRDLIEKSKQKGAGTIVSKLCQAYDVPPYISARTRGQPTSIVREPVLSVQACTNPDWMLDLDVKDLQGGLGSRVCFVPGDPKPPDRRWQPPDPASTEAIIDRLKSVRLAYPLNSTRAFTITEAGEMLLDRWYIRQKTMANSDALIAKLSVRDIVHVYKVALIYAALDLHPVIEDYHVKAAIFFVDFLRDARPVLFEGHGFSPTQIAQAAAERIIQSRKRISYSEALGLFKRHGDSMLFKRITDSLCLPGGPIEVQMMGNRRPKRYLVWRGDN